MVEIFFIVVGLVLRLFVTAILLDPAVIVELPDGTLLEIITWFE